MAYIKGNSASALDYNTFVGANDITSAYASSVAATQKVAALLGIGYGDRGYGQASPSLAPITSGHAYSINSWLNLRNAIATMASFQGTATTLLPPTTAYVSGSKIIAEVPATTAYDIPTMIANIDNNRFNTNSGASLSVTNGSLVVTRATAWGGGSTAITAEVTATFPSENAARFFFNSGGAINLILANPNTSTTQNLNWNTVLAALGTISIGASSTTRSGSGGTPIALGYYGLTSAYQTVFNGTDIGTGAYTLNSVLVQALSLNIVGLNGGKGTAVKIGITLTDGHTNTFSDLVALGTNASFGYKKAAVGLTGIASPTFATVTNF